MRVCPDSYFSESARETNIRAGELQLQRVKIIMSILNYFKPRDGLPDPKGSLSSCLSSQAIAAINKEVEKVMPSSNSIAKKRG